MSIPFTAQASFTAPLAVGLTPLPLPWAMASAYSNSAAYRLVFASSGTKTLNMGTLGPNGAKLFFLTVDADPTPGVQPLLVAINSATPGIEVSQGGILLLGSPSPTTAGLLTVSLTYTSALACNVWVFG